MNAGRRLLLVLLMLLPMPLWAIGFCANGPFTHEHNFSRGALPVQVPVDDGGQYVLVMERSSTYTGCTSLGILPSVNSSISTSYGNGGNAAAPAGAGLPAGFDGLTARRFLVDGNPNLYFQVFYRIESGGSPLHCGMDGGTCSLSLIGLQLGANVTFRTYTLLVVNDIRSLIGTSRQVEGGLGRLRVTQGLLGSIFVDMRAGLDYVFSQASCNLLDTSQVVTLPPVGTAQVSAGDYAASTGFAIRLDNCVVPRSLTTDSNTFASSLIRLSFLASAGGLASGSNTDILPTNSGDTDAAQGVALQIRRAGTATPVEIGTGDEITAPFGMRDPADTTETFDFSVGLVPVAGQPVEPGMIEGAVTFQVEYR